MGLPLIHLLRGLGKYDSSLEGQEGRCWECHVVRLMRAWQDLRAEIGPSGCWGLLPWNTPSWHVCYMIFISSSPSLHLGVGRHPSACVIALGCSLACRPCILGLAALLLEVLAFVS